MTPIIITLMFLLFWFSMPQTRNGIIDGLSFRDTRLSLVTYGFIVAGVIGQVIVSSIK